MIGILGGGFSGLSLAYLYNGTSQIVEKNKNIGGHCRSHTKDGFRYDEGGHILFSRDQELLQRLLAVLRDNVGQHYRLNKIWFKNRFVKYPFENGLGGLEKEDIYECLIHYLQNDYPEPSNFREWIYYTFGKGIADSYLVPYNEKIWKTDLTRMTIDWAGARVPRPPTEDIVKSALGISTEGYAHQLNFFYPKCDGIQALPDSLALLAQEKSTIVTDYEINSLKKTQDGWVVSNGTSEHCFEKIVSTIPVQILLNCLDKVPADIRQAADDLRFNSSLFVLIGLADCRAKDITSVYFPSPDLPFHRVGFPHSYDPTCVPAGKYAAVAEISSPAGKSRWLSSDDDIIEEVIRALVKERFFNAADVLAVDITRAPYSYVVYDINHRKNITRILSYIKELGIEMLGRFSQFEYWNLDQCFYQAEILSEKLNRS
ncbi:protoporphyrinogen/coproporphyrinogen oxidase [Chloroflexota bacterium]